MDNKATDFEDGLQRIEQIIKELNQNEVPLEKALKLYEEGINLIRSCNKLLDASEKKMEVLLEDINGEIKSKTYNLKMEV